MTMVLIIHTKNASYLTNRYWDMVPTDRKSEWTDARMRANNLEKQILHKRENLQFMKTADSILLSLFLRTERKGNKSHAP